jgi:hypothetical protein
MDATIVYTAIAYLSSPHHNANSPNTIHIPSLPPKAWTLVQPLTKCPAKLWLVDYYQHLYDTCIRARFVQAQID